MSQFTIAEQSISYPVMGFIMAFGINEGYHRQAVYSYAEAYMHALRHSVTAENVDTFADDRFSVELMGYPSIGKQMALHAVFHAYYIQRSNGTFALQRNLERAHIYCVRNSEAYIKLKGDDHGLLQ